MEIEKIIKDALEVVRVAPIESNLDMPWGIDRKDIDRIAPEVAKLIIAKLSKPDAELEKWIVTEIEVYRCSACKDYYIGCRSCGVTESSHKLARTILSQVSAYYEARQVKAVEQVRKEEGDKYKKAMINALPLRYLRKVLELLGE